MTRRRSPEQLLRTTIETRPDDQALRLHLAHLLVECGLAEEVIARVAAVLPKEPPTPTRSCSCSGPCLAQIPPRNRAPR